MSLSIIGRLLPTVLISGAVFSSLTLPLVVLGSEQISIQVQNEQMFNGKLREVATPYLGLAGALSVATGIASISLGGWRESSRKSALVEENLSQLQQNLQQKEVLLEEIKLSESRLEAFGLSAFLQEEMPCSQSVNAEVVPAQVQPVVVEMPRQVAEPIVVTATSLERSQQPLTTMQTAVQSSAAQAYLGYVQARTAVQVPTVSTQNQANMTTATLESVEQLRNQLQQIVAQVSTLSESLQAQPETTQFEYQVPVVAQRAVERSEAQLPVLAY